MYSSVYAVNMLQEVLLVNKSHFKCSRKAHFYTKETDADSFMIYLNTPPCLGNHRTLRAALLSLAQTFIKMPNYIKGAGDSPRLAWPQHPYRASLRGRV